MECRNRASYFWPYGVTRSALKTALALAVLMIGLLGFTAGGFWFWSIACKNAIVTAVLAAAPFKFNRMVPENSGSMSRAAPPPYVNVTSPNVHCSQFNPSKGCSRASRPMPDISGPRGGTVGSAPVAPIPMRGPCANIDVWLPKSMKNSSTLEVPATNDPNATVILDIRPPLAYSLWFRGADPPSHP
jgi:hypothetical protein